MALARALALSPVSVFSLLLVSASACNGYKTLFLRCSGGRSSPFKMGERSKHHQAAARQRGNSHQHNTAAKLAEGRRPTLRDVQPEPANPTTPIITQSIIAHVPAKNTSSPTPIPTPAPTGTAFLTKNTTSPAFSPAQRGAANTTSLATSHLPSPPSAPQPIIPQRAAQSSPSSASLVQPPGGVNAQQSTQHGMSTGQKVLLAAGLLSSLSVLGYLISWWLKRRHRRLASARKVDKFTIKGPFKNSEDTLADSDSEPIFGPPGHASISFDHLQVLTEKSGRPDLLFQPRLPYPQPTSRSPTRSSLTLQPAASDPKSLPKLNPLLPSHLNDRNSPDGRCLGPDMKGKTFVVERTYQASLDDELVLHVGDTIEVVFYYDDGWCLGRNLDIERYGKDQLSKGVFPRDCVGAQPIDTANKGPERGSGRPNEWDLASPQRTADDAEQESRSAFRAISSNPSLSPLSSSIFEKFPLPPRTNNRLEAHQRVSSLLIGRNAQLFLELDDALGQPESPPHIHFATPPKLLK